MLNSTAEAEIAESNRQKEFIADYRNRIVACVVLAFLLSPLVIFPYSAVSQWFWSLMGYNSQSILDEPISNNATYRNPVAW